MIVGEQKNIDEIAAMLEKEDFDNLLITGCGTCVTVSMAGGEREVNALAEILQAYFASKNKNVKIQKATVKRQCDFEFLDDLENEVDSTGLVLSLGCGVGVQHLAERFPDKVVLPGLNTSFYGAVTNTGELAERCIGCGNCVLDEYHGVCPIARCSKSLLNGPCGGSQDGKCEVDPEIDCGWQLIYDRVKRLNKLEVVTGYHEPKDWQTYRDGGPRKHVNKEYFGN